MGVTATDPFQEAAKEGTVAQLARELVRLSRGTQAMRSHLISRGPQLVEWSTFVLLFHLIEGGPQRSSAFNSFQMQNP